MDNKQVFITIKNDAIERNIANDIYRYLKDGLKLPIHEPIRIILSEEEVMQIKEDEFRNKWKDYPEGDVLRYLLNYEAQEVWAVPCDYMGDETFKILHQLKGNHHIPYMCNHDSIRWKYRDKEQIGRLFEYSDEILLEKWKNGNITFPATIMHTPDSDKENEILKGIILNKEEIKDDK